MCAYCLQKARNLNENQERSKFRNNVVIIFINLVSYKII